MRGLFPVCSGSRPGRGSKVVNLYAKSALSTPQATNTMCGQTKMNLTGSNATWMHHFLRCLSCLNPYTGLSFSCSLFIFYCQTETLTVTGFRCIIWHLSYSHVCGVVYN